MMSKLTKIKCVACHRDAPQVTDAEIAEFHPQIPDWQIVEHDGMRRLERVFSFSDFVPLKALIVLSRVLFKGLLLNKKFALIKL